MLVNFILEKIIWFKHLITFDFKKTYFILNKAYKYSKNPIYKSKIVSHLCSLRTIVTVLSSGCVKSTSIHLFLFLLPKIEIL